MAPAWYGGSTRGSETENEEKERGAVWGSRNNHKDRGEKQIRSNFGKKGNIWYSKMSIRWKKEYIHIGEKFGGIRGHLGGN